MPNTTKKCKACGGILPLLAFHAARTGRYGVASRCKACMNAAKRAAYSENTSLEQRRKERAGERQAEILRRQTEGKECCACVTYKPPVDFLKASRRFDGMQDCCKACASARAATYRLSNPEKARAYAKARNSRPEFRAQKNAAKRAKNIDRLSSRTEHYWHYVQWRQWCTHGFFEALDPTPHDAHVRAYPAKERVRRLKAMCDPGAHRAHVTAYFAHVKKGRSNLTTRAEIHKNLYTTFKGWLRKRLRHTLADGFSWARLFPYTQECVARHIEAQFLPGMGWHNRTDWHIDHKRPVAAFEIPQAQSNEFAECFALGNLQPLWATDNIKKGAKIPHCEIWV